jgi:hypothetical protein
MECSLEELVRKLTILLADHPDATVCIERQRSDRLTIEDGSKSFLDVNGNRLHGYGEEFLVTTDENKFLNDEDCVVIEKVVY